MMKILPLFPLLLFLAIVLLTGVDVVCAQEPLQEPAAIQYMEERNATRDILNKGHAAIPAAEKVAIINKWSSVKFDHGINPAFVWTWVLIIAIAVSGILLLFFWWTKSLKKQVQNRTAKLNATNKSLAFEITGYKQAEEQERRRIAEDLHDHVGQSLALARMQLAAARKGVAKSDKRDAQFDDISQSLLKAVQDTRHLIFELSSPSLNELGLPAAISEWMDENVVKQHGIEAELFDHAQELSLNVDLRAILFRNVRELLTNAIKHARAKTISVWLESRAEGLEITVQDDGVGFGVGVVGGAQYGDEDLCFPDLTGVLIDDRCRMTGVVHKQLLPGAVILAHDQILFAQPLAIVVTEPAVLITLWMLLPVLLPEQELCDTLAFEFAMNNGPTGDAAFLRRQFWGGWEESMLQRGITQFIRQRPG